MSDPVNETALEPQPRRQRRRVIVPPGVVAVPGVIAVTAVVVVSLALSATWALGIHASLMGAYWAASALGGLSLTVAWLALRRWGRGAWAGGFGRGAFVVLVVAAAARIAVAIAGPPFLSDDIWRYIHDGRTLGLLGDNPYAASPAETDPAYRGNNPQLVTIYQPASQWVFAALARVAAWPHALAADTVFRLGFVAIDCGTIALLLLALRRRGRAPWWAMLYAWHPLAITEVAGAGHQDPIGIALLVASLTVADLAVDARRSGARLARAAGCGALLAASVAVKPIVGPVAIFIAVSWWRTLARDRGPAVALAGVAGLLTLAGGYLPFAAMEGGLSRMFETVSTFTRVWSFNASLHALAEAAVGSKRVADLAMGSLLGATVAVLAWRVWRTRARDDPWAAEGGYLLAALLLSSTVHPWYVLWPLALLPLSRGVATWVLSLTVTASYAAWLSLEAGGSYAVPAWLRWLEYGPVYAALAVSGWLAIRARGRSGCVVRR
mgnify:CR=1 FL=1